MKLTPYGHRPSALTGRIDMLLYRGEHTFREIADILDCPLSKLSAHMDKLRKMGFIVRVDRRTMKIRVQKITVVRKENIERNEAAVVEPTQRLEGKSPNGHRLGTLAGSIDQFMHDFYRERNHWPDVTVISETLQISRTNVVAHVNFYKRRGKYAD